MPLKVDGGTSNQLAGYQPDLVYLAEYSTHDSCSPITAIAINSAYALLVFVEYSICESIYTF